MKSLHITESLKKLQIDPTKDRQSLLKVADLSLSFNGVPMTNPHEPVRPPNSFRIVLNLNSRQSRMDNVLLSALKDQKENLDLRNISRGALKELFLSGKIQIKGQKAKPSSALAVGTTYVDILGF